jgi:arylformamidase
MKIHDITLTISNDLPTWPGDPKVVLERVNKIEEGANANVSRLDIGVHTGTHVDAPFHFLKEGTTVDTLALDILIGEVQIIQIPDEVAEVSRKDLEAAGIGEGIVRLLIKSRNSKYWASGEMKFQTGFVGIAEDGAQYLVEKGIQLVGIDYLSIAPYKQSRPTHRVLLKAKIIIIEGIDLSAVKPGMYQLICLPMKLGGSDGAPCRAILIED